MLVVLSHFLLTKDLQRTQLIAAAAALRTLHQQRTSTISGRLQVCTFSCCSCSMSWLGCRALPLLTRTFSCPSEREVLPLPSLLIQKKRRLKLSERWQKVGMFGSLPWETLSNILNHLVHVYQNKVWYRTGEVAELEVAIEGWSHSVAASLPGTSTIYRVRWRHKQTNPKLISFQHSFIQVKVDGIDVVLQVCSILVIYFSRRFGLKFLLSSFSAPMPSAIRCNSAVLLIGPFHFRHMCYILNDSCGGRIQLMNATEQRLVAFMPEKKSVDTSKSLVRFVIRAYNV